VTLINRPEGGARAELELQAARSAAPSLGSVS